MLNDLVVTYEQFPFDAARVRSLAGSHQSGTDPGVWNAVQGKIAGCAIWRIGQGHRVQILKSESNCIMMDSLKLVEAMDTEDDGDWQVTSGGKGSGFSVTSGFAITYGEFPWQGELNDWLCLYGLELRHRVGCVQGEAHFSEISTMSFHNALRRLHWLESFCVRVNRQVELTAKRTWFQVDQRCRQDQAHLLLDPDELLSPPDLYGA